MIKRFVAFATFFTTIFTFSSCGLIERVDLDSALYNKVDYVSDHENSHHIEYSGEQYFLDSEMIFNIADANEQSGDDVFLGWNGSRFGYVNKYYSNTNIAPLFIYETRTRSVYLRGNYDYQSDIFTVADTNLNITFSNALIETDFNISVGDRIVNKISLVIYSELYPRLQISLNVFFEADKWYAHIPNSDKVYIVAQSFVEMLLANKLIFNY